MAFRINRIQIKFAILFDLNLKSQKIKLMHVLDDKTNMHSSRMRTVRSSDRISGLGCLLPGRVSALGGVCSSGGVCSWGVGCLLPGVGCLLPGGVCSQEVSAPRGGGVSAPRGVSAPGGVSAWGGVCSLGGSALGGCLLPGGCVSALGVCVCGIPACTEADTPTPYPTPFVDRQTPVKT